MAAVDGRTQLFVLPASGGEARQVTRSPTGIVGYAWKPDGSAFAYRAFEEPAKRGSSMTPSRSTPTTT
ncbi:MAG: hypothetical protein IPN16_23980 [Gemmatimonadetes bacterium]|nr:hypothetical protein [Gemmatimonadota bacterium]